MKRKREADIESDNLHSIRHVIKDTFMQIENQAKACSRKGIPSGFSALDELTSGFHTGELIIIGGRPSAGKTTLGLNIARHVGLILKKPVIFFSLEMSKEQVALRLLCAEAKTELNSVKNGFIKKEDWEKLTDAAYKLSIAPIFIDDSASITAEEIRNKAKSFKKEHKEMGVMIIDYLQLLGDSNADKKRQSASAICKELKTIAKDVKTTIIVLSHVSRSAERRCKPTIADIRGLSDKDADVILFI